MNTSRFGQIPQRVAGMRGLSGADLRVLIAIASFANKEGTAFPGMSAIAGLTGIDRSDVPRSIRRLEKAGVIRRTRGKSPALTNTYAIVFDGVAIREPDDIDVADGVSANLMTGVRESDDRVSSNLRLGVRESDDQTEYNRPINRGRARGAPAKYAFEGAIIRLTRDDLDKWRESFSAIPDLTAELRAIDAKFVDDGVTDKWFGKAAAWLRAKHERIQRDRKTRDGSSWGAPGFA